MCGWSSIPPMWPSAHPVTGVFFFFTLRPPQLSYSLFGRPTSVCLKAMISTSMLRIDGKWWKCGFHQQDRGFAKLNTRTNGYSLKFKRECRISTMDSTLGCWENFGGNRQPNSNIQINHFVGVARLPGCPARNPPGILWLYKLALKSTFYRFCVKIAIWGNIELADFQTSPRIRQMYLHHSSSIPDVPDLLESTRDLIGSAGPPHPRKHRKSKCTHNLTSSPQSSAFVVERFPVRGFLHNFHVLPMYIYIYTYTYKMCIYIYNCIYIYINM